MPTLLSPNNFTQGHLLKIELLVADVTAAGSPDRVECAILAVILAQRFRPIQPVFVIGKPLCDVRTPSPAPISLLRVIE